MLSKTVEKGVQPPVHSNVETMGSLSKGIKATEFPNNIYWTTSVNLVTRIVKQISTTYMNWRLIPSSTVLLSSLVFLIPLDTLSLVQSWYWLGGIRFHS